jgi:hypothetical protein
MVADHLRTILVDLDDNDLDDQKKLARIKENATSALGLVESMQKGFEERSG